MNLLNHIAKVANAISSNTLKKLQPHFKSQDNLRMSFATCALSLDAYSCDPVNSAWGKALQYVFSEFQPAYTKYTADRYSFRWGDNAFSMNCSVGRCLISPTPQPQPEISATEIILGILSGPAGCTVDQPIPINNDQAPKQVSFPDRLMFTASKVMSMSCFTKKSFQELNLSEIIYLEGIYKDKFGQQLIQPESSNFESLLLYLSRSRPRVVDSQDFKFQNDNSFFIMLSNTTLWELNGMGSVSDKIIIGCQPWYGGDDNSKFEDTTPFWKYGYSNWGDSYYGEGPCSTSYEHSAKIGIAANKTKTLLLIYLRNPIHDCWAEYSAGK